jgi:hypothetical protein
MRIGEAFEAETVIPGEIGNLAASMIGPASTFSTMRWAVAPNSAARS